MKEKNLEKIFGVPSEILEFALITNQSAQGYLHGAISEYLLNRNLLDAGFEVKRIKEKPAGGFDSKNIDYKGDFLIRKPNDEKWMVVECKGIKTNSEFRGTNKIPEKNRKMIINKIKSLIDIDKTKVYQKGLKTYTSTKSKWENNNPGKSFPDFAWSLSYPGPVSADMTNYFKTKASVSEYFNSLPLELFNESSFRNRTSAYLVFETHKPSNRTDINTNIKQAAPLVTDFSILAVDLFQRLGSHKFVFANSNDLSHSPTSPNHLYQNYLIDILIPGVKNDLTINRPWFENINNLIQITNPKKVEYDESQIDHRDN